MSKRIDYEYRQDYVQSANSLSHFMEKREFLTDALERRALVPRYCLEDVDYMNIKNAANIPITEIAVLQKCFCDIPFHRLKEKFDIIAAKGQDLSNEDKSFIENNEINTHAGFYGGYAISFSKEWCVERGLQPIMYINEKSEYLNTLRRMFTNVITGAYDDSVADDLLLQIAFAKPLQGTMSRDINNDRNIKLEKNFHDEHEWRYIPKDTELKQTQLGVVYAKRVLKDHRKEINKNLETKKYEPIWLKFEYEDIKYVIVPDQKEREELIGFILDIPSENFDDELDRNILMSKILVLDDIKRDC